MGMAPVNADWDGLHQAVGMAAADTLRQFRAAVDTSFPDRLQGLILFGAHARGQGGRDDDWTLAVLIEDFDPAREGQRLHALAEPFRARGFFIAPVGLSDDMRKADPDLSHRIDHEGIPVSAPDRMAVAEFCCWQRDEPDLHDLVDGQPKVLSPEKQAARRMWHALAAVAAAHGGDIDAADEWLTRPHTVFGAPPLEVLNADWAGLVRVLEELAAVAPGCTAYNRKGSTIRLGVGRCDLLENARRLAAIEAAR